VLPSILGALALVCIGSALSAASPLALKSLVDALAQVTSAGATSGSMPLIAAAVAYAFLLVFGRLSADVRPLLSGAVEQRLQAVLRQRFFDHVLNLPIAYVLRRRPGELLHSLDLAAAGVQSVSTHLLNSIAPAIIELAVMALILFRLGALEITGLFALTACMYVIVFAIGAARLARSASDISAASMHVYAQLNAGVSSVETLRCFTAEPQARAALQEANGLLEARWLLFTRRSVGLSIAVSAVFTLSFASCLAITIRAASQGELTLGGCVLAMVYMLQMVRPLEVLGSTARDFARASAFLRPLEDLLAEPSEQSAVAFSPRAASISPRKAAPSLRVENLHFGYDPMRPVIRGINLEIPAGCTTAIVGRSGSGKSSLARLLMRLFSPQTGAIFLDGMPIEKLAASEVRARIGLVPQDTSLLHASIADNIALGMPDASHEDIELVARAAELHDLITSMPEGYDTLVGERGLQLSGGERQRVAIARALLRRPTLFVFDEPTSMLDSKTESNIQQALRDATAGCTTIIIAHRLSAITEAHDIVVLDDGKIKERGRHHELLAMGGLYAEMWRQQARIAA
jgi:ATP-binding cassette subfamily B protein